MVIPPRINTSTPLEYYITLVFFEEHA